jgi:drug/metabolite transporter (DMT)-like permease
MSFSPYLLIPLACGLFYVLSMLCLKRAGELGVGLWRTTFVANWACTLVFLPWWFHTGWAPVEWTLYWQPAVSALIFLVAQVLMFLAITRGDVSVAAPVMGVKVILVALISSMLFAEGVPLKWWIGAGMSTAAVGLLNLGRGTTHRRVGPTVLLTLVSASLYSLNDVLMQHWGHAWGAGYLLPPLFLFVGLYSFVLLRFAHGGIFQIAPRAWGWVIPGSFFNALTNGGIALTLGIWGNATAVNIVYSSRGLFSVILVWAAGHWFANTERHAGRSVLLTRLIGAVLILAAIALVVV